MKKKTKGRRGPEPGRLKLEGDWRDLMKSALKKKRPAEGWGQGSKPKKR